MRAWPPVRSVPEVVGERGMCVCGLYMNWLWCGFVDTESFMEVVLGIQY